MVVPPGMEPFEIDRGRCSNMLQMRFLKTTISGATYFQSMNCLRNRTFNPSPICITIFEFIALFIFTSPVQYFMLFPWVNRDLSPFPF